ncbi:MAG: hypothetical protein IJG31_00725, partial [Fusobacterium sp.]|nr:hypothetical protein [Fusobacterium sp.]
IAFGGKPRGLDPHMSPEIVSGLLSQQIFNSLVDIDENGDIIPEIAESWEFLDEKTLVFNLKPQIKFHNGEELRASDVVFSINRMKTKPASMVMVEPIQSAEVIEDYKVKINLNKAFSSILYNLAHPRTSILSEKNVNELNDDLSTSVIGTGPFKLISWGTGEEINLERFPEHFLGSPNYEKLIITELDKLIEEGRTTSNPEERKKSYEEAQQIIHDDIVCVPLYYSMDNVAMDKRIRNFKFRQTFFHDIKDIIIE